MEGWPTTTDEYTWAVFRTPWHVNFQRVFWNRMFRALKEPSFSGSITLEILKVWRWSFFSKWWKFYLNFKNVIITPENVFGFEDKCVGTCCRNFCLLWQEYMQSTVNVLKDGRNISDRTKRPGTQLPLFNFNGRFTNKCCCAELSSV